VDRNSFDVVIVDEASQVGVEHLYLLWLAPRVIVVGDDKQCTPGENRLGGHERIFANLDRYLDGVDQDIRVHFTPKSDLYGMLSARSGKNAVIRLREHFRCVPEIIGWSSTQFYAAGGTKGLIPLREHVESDLEPLQVRYVPGAFPEGRNLNLRNPVEAKAIADELALCIADPQYEGKTLGVVVLQGRGQVRLLEHEINARVTPEQRIDRQIRVGIPSDFQGDERDVIFLSMVVAEPPRAQKAPRYQQAFNVAASRAKDQLWLFLSVRDADLKHDDLRASLLGYMRNPPSTYGPSPALEAVSETDPCQPFESMLEQRVFREIRGRGYHVVPQYEVGTKTLDLVVVGSAGRLAVECDGHYWHTSPAQTDSDARRDRDLRRMGWDVVRVRESEFEFDRSREMARVWAALTARGIEPAAVEPLRQVGSEAAVSHDWWAPVDLSDADDETEDLDD
jgi:very-short-patch-repair endonuclease